MLYIKAAAPQMTPPAANALLYLRHDAYAAISETAPIKSQEAALLPLDQLPKLQFDYEAYNHIPTSVKYL